MSFPAFCIFMKKEFRKHLSEQREYMNRSMRGEVERCVNCGLPTDWTCGCRGSDVAPPSSLEVIPDDFDKEEESVTL